MNWGAIIQAGAQIADKAAPYIIDNHWKHREIGMQYDFAKNQIQWRVDDAKKAGLHPLYALGASPMTPNAQVVGGQGSGGLGFTEAFQTVANSSYDKQLQKQTLEMNQLKIDNQKMQNDLMWLQSVAPPQNSGQAPLSSSNISSIQTPSPSGLTSATPQNAGLAKDLEPRYALNPVEARPNVYKMGPSTQSWLQDAISEFGIATVPEQARYILNNETVFGMSEYKHLAQIFNEINAKKGISNRFYAFNDSKYGPVLVEDKPNDKYNFDYYYGKGGRNASVRDRISDWYNDTSFRFGRSPAPKYYRDKVNYGQ